jgi:hypothetical protein
MIENDLDILQFGCHVEAPKKIEVTDDKFIELLHEKLHDMYCNTTTEKLDKYELYDNQKSNDNTYEYITFIIILLLIVIVLNILFQFQNV